MILEVTALRSTHHLTLNDWYWVEDRRRNFAQMDALPSAVQWRRKWLRGRWPGPPWVPVVHRRMWRLALRDGWRCAYCWTVDHVVPTSRGGSDDPENLRLACPSCNSSKGARTLAEWLAA